MKKITAKKLEALVDAGKTNVLEYFDTQNPLSMDTFIAETRAGKTASLHIDDIPVSLLDRLDYEAAHLGVPRQSLVKIWLAERVGYTSSTTKPLA